MSKEEMEKVLPYVAFIIVLLNLGFTLTVLLKITIIMKNDITIVSSEDYDVSSMNEVNIKGANSLFEDNLAHVLFIGSQTDAACLKHVRILNSVSNKLDFIVQYLDIDKITVNDDGYSKFIKYLNKEATIEIDGEKVTDTLGNFIGYTPMTIIIKNNEMYDGYIGVMNENQLAFFVEKIGIYK